MTRQNLIPNPAAKVNATGYSGTGTPVRATDFPANMPRQTGVRATASGFVQTPAAPCAAGDVFTVSFYQHNGSAAFQFTRTVYIAYTRSSGGDVFPETFTTPTLGDVGASNRVSFTTAAAPANATGIYLVWDSLVSGLGMTAVLLEKVSALDAYGDGDVPGWQWDGTAGNSASTMVAETLFSGQEPVSHDNSDATTYSLASYITTAVAGTVTHIRRWAALNYENHGENVVGALFDWNTGDKISSLVADAPFTSGIKDWWDYVALDPPVHVAAGARIAPHIRAERYVSSTGGASPWPITSGDLSTSTGAGRFHDMGASAYNDPAIFAADAFNSGCYFVDLVFVPDGGDEPAGGVVTLGLGLAVAAAGSAAHEGVTDTGLGLAVAAAGATAHAGVVALTLDLGVSAAGSRSASGAAALGLNLAPSGVGSDGSAARPRGPRLISRNDEARIVSRNGDPRIVTRVQVAD